MFKTEKKQIFSKPYCYVQIPQLAKPDLINNFEFTNPNNYNVSRNSNKRNEIRSMTPHDLLFNNLHYNDLYSGDVGNNDIVEH